MDIEESRLGDQDTEPPAVLRKVEVEKVVVLSFRALQLQRIADLQDEVLDLVVKAPTEATSRLSINAKIDSRLGHYGRYYLTC